MSLDHFKKMKYAQQFFYDLRELKVLTVIPTIEIAIVGL